MRRRAASVLVLFTLLALASEAALAQSAQYQLESEAHAGLPFVVSVVVSGFEEEPEPQLDDLEIAGATVRFLGVSPRVSSFRSNINGRVTERRDVTFVYSYRVTVEKGGRISLPSLTVRQDDKEATARGATVEVGEIDRTDDMRVAMTVPDRPLWVGETFEAHIDWYLRRDVSDQQLVVPMFDMEDRFEVDSAGVTGRRGMAFAAGSRELKLPYVKSSESVDGLDYTRFRFSALVTPLVPGELELPPVVAVAKLQVGVTRDRFGFRVPAYDWAKAVGTGQRLTVKPLPMSGRPASFAGAVGSSFSIEVRADRTVVAVGEPVRLDMLIRGDTSLAGLRLPELDRAGLDPGVFQLPAGDITGEIVPDQNGKRFAVTVRLRTAEARQVPPIAFSYFDPKTGGYETVESQAIALSVKGSAVVGASDVESVVRPGGESSDWEGGVASLTGADLSLSSPAETMATVTTAGTLRIWLLLLYLVPLLAVFGRFWQVRTADRRGEAGSLRAAANGARVALERAASEPARDVAGALISSLRALARLAASELDPALVERIETEAYAPSAATQPLSAGIVDDARQFVERAARSRSTRGGSAAAGLLLVVAASMTPVTAQAEAEGGETASVEKARELYGAALAEEERAPRTRAFAEAEAVYADLVARYPGRPELLVDLGNAALGAGNLGHAVLAYRRALALDPTHERARVNLAWVRDRAPEWLPKPSEASAVSRLFFWHDALTPAEKQFGGAMAFALFVLLLAPWYGPVRTRALRQASVAPFLIFVALVGSALLTRAPTEDAVVVGDDAVLRAADNDGAPLAFDRPLPAATEVRVLEERERWTRVELASGQAGWLPASAVARVITPPAVEE